MIYAALQGTTWSHFPRLFQEPAVFVFFIVLSVYSLVCLWNCRFPILVILSHDSPNLLQNPTCPWLTKAIYLVSAAGAMGLFGGEKPDTVLSVKR